MALRLTLTVLLISAVFGTSLAQFRRLRLVRAADPAAAAARPAAPASRPAAPPSSPSADKDASIVQQSMDFEPADNSYSYSYETSNGIKARGTAKDSTVRQEGSFVMFAEDGSPVEMSYVADENGYQVSGALVPQAHPLILKAVEYLRSLPPQPEEVEEAKAVKP